MRPCLNASSLSSSGRVSRSPLQLTSLIRASPPRSARPLLAVPEQATQPLHGLLKDFFDVLQDALAVLFQQCFSLAKSLPLVPPPVAVSAAVQSRPLRIFGFGRSSPVFRHRCLSSAAVPPDLQAAHLKSLLNRCHLTYAR